MDFVKPSEGPAAEADRFARDWADRLLSTSPLTDGERGELVGAVRRCYMHAGLPWPDRVVWVPSPIAGRLLAVDLQASLRSTLKPPQTSSVKLAMAGPLLCAGLALVQLLILPGNPVGSRFLREASPGPEYWRSAWIGGVVGGLLLITILWSMTMSVWEDTELRNTYIVGIVGAGPFAVLLPCELLADVIVGRAAGPPSSVWIVTLLAATLTPAATLTAVAGVVIGWRRRRSVLGHTDPAFDLIRQNLATALITVDACARRSMRKPAHTSVGRSVSELTFAVSQSIEHAVHRDSELVISSFVLTGRADVERGHEPAGSRAGELAAKLSGMPDAVELSGRSGRRTLHWRYPVGHFGGDFGGIHDLNRLVGASWLVATGAPIPADAGALVGDFVVASQLGWWWPHTRFVVISERPSVLRIDSRNRLDSTDGPAAEWPDGYRIGTHVDFPFR
ncbi:DUF6745 domain-containing protein [Actinoplanes derwentensis]|nr:hypothetical protein [Actinoplanes derwentensis]